jgi:hypothetical protein
MHMALRDRTGNGCNARTRRRILSGRQYPGGKHHEIYMGIPGSACKGKRSCATRSRRPELRRIPTGGGAMTGRPPASRGRSQ